jgi:hypothetical protein
MGYSIAIRARYPSKLAEDDGVYVGSASAPYCRKNQTEQALKVKMQCLEGLWNES